MYHVSAEGVNELMINVNYYYRFLQVVLGDSQTTLATILTDSVSLLQKANSEWEAQTGTC